MGQDTQPAAAMIFYLESKITGRIPITADIKV